MKPILNIIWLVLAGLWMAIAYAIAAVIMFIFIITIPFGIQALKIGVFALWPFGRTVIKREGAGAPSFVGNLLWLLLAGWWLALGHVITGILLALTIIGIPLALANFKLIPISLWPFGREIVPTSVARQLDASAVTVDTER
jgi:uncharacterized membrane protein YccF (DUF307 family)